MDAASWVLRPGTGGSEGVSQAVLPLPASCEELSLRLSPVATPLQAGLGSSSPSLCLVRGRVSHEVGLAGYGSSDAV